MTNLTPIYQGQFGEFTITDEDRREVMIYRGGLMIAALSLMIATGLLLFKGEAPETFNLITQLYAVFSLGLGISLMTIHIYVKPLHLLLKAFWVIGTISSIILTLNHAETLSVWVYHHPITLWGVGFTFAALTGIYFKEAFCFNRLETKILTPLVPFLFLGHLLTIIPSHVEIILLSLWAILFMIFAIRKGFQSIPDDIGDKSVFEYLKQKN